MIICLQCRRPRFDPQVRKIPWRRKWLPTPVFLPGEFPGQRSLMGYSPWGCKELDTTQQLNNNNKDFTNRFNNQLDSRFYGYWLHSEIFTCTVSRSNLCNVCPCLCTLPIPSSGTARPDLAPSPSMMQMHSRSGGYLLGQFGEVKIPPSACFVQVPHCTDFCVSEVVCFSAK